MDPRHPEQAISRMRELIKQYDRIETDMAKATTSAQLAQLEREGGLVVQEICLVAPRIHEAMMQASRQRRRDLSRGVVEKPVMVKLERPLTEEEGKKIVESISSDKADEPVEKVEELTFEQQHIKHTLELDKELEVNEKPAEKSEMEYRPEQGGGTVTLEWKPMEKSAQSVEKTEVKPKKKTTRKKKTTKKAEK